ncbi:metallophosphoesterase [Pseudomonas sp. R2.Fl]|nr:metallophosphoesterase [Pseudomonas sp. R2.Fl]
MALRIALLSDIHANREAMEAVLANAAARQATGFVLLGDIVGYGPDPVWCVEKAMSLTAAGAAVVRGNHDQAVGDPSISMNTVARTVIDWTATVLGDDHKAFLSSLPLSATAEDRLYVHAEASAPARFHYVTDADAAAAHFAASEARLGFCGHVHRPALYALGTGGKVTSFTPTRATAIPLLNQRRWLAVVGAVGQPRDGDPAAGYALLDTETNELCFLKVPYDVDRTVAKIRAAGLPEALAARLSRGA